MLDFVEMLADETGLPVGIKSAVGDLAFWQDLTDLMARDDRGVDFVTIDGGEGGTGASPLIFTDAVSLPFRLGFARVYAEFARRGLHEEVTFIGAGKLGLPDNAIVAFALGADMVNVGSRGDARGRVHPGSEVPHRRVARPASPPSTRGWPTAWTPSTKGERVANYVQDPAAGPPQGRRDLRRRRTLASSGRDSIEVARHPRRRPAARRGLRLRAGLGLPVRRRIGTRSRRSWPPTDEEEAETEGPPETAEEGQQRQDAAGE